MKIKRTVSLAFAFVLLFSCLCLQGTVVFAASSAVVSSALQVSDVMLEGTFNNWEGTAMYFIDDTTVSTTLDLEAGNYQLKIKDGDTEYGHPGTIKDTTAEISSSGFKLSDSVNAKCTLIATGGSYTFTYNTETNKLGVIKDNNTPAETEGSLLTVNFGEEAVTANVGDTLTYGVFLTADKPFEDVQTILSYNEEKLSLVKAVSTDEDLTEEEIIKYCPNIKDAILNIGYEGVVAANASSVAGYDFTEEKLFLTLDFKVVKGGETSLEFTAQEMTATDGVSYYTYSTEEASGAVFRENLEITEKAQLPEGYFGFNGASLTLYDNLAINFKTDEKIFAEDAYTDPYAVFELNGIKSTVSEYQILNGRCVFDFVDISPANVNDTVYATLYATYNGVEYQSTTVEYSVADYCYNMLSKYYTDEYAELRTLLVDLLNYGAASQIYVNHNTDALANAELTEEQAAFGTSEKPTYENMMDLKYKTVSNPTVLWYGGGLNLETAVTMRFKIHSENNYENLTVKAVTDSYTWEIPYSEFEETTNGYYVFFSGFNAGQMREPVYFTVYEGDTAVSNTLRYSIESYAYSQQNSSDTNLTNLLEAMIKYGDAAYAYVN